MSELRTNKIYPRDGITAGTYNGGGIIQVVQGVSNSPFTTTSHVNTAYVDVTGLNVTITPKSASNKVLVKFFCYNGVDGNNVIFIRLYRDSTFIGQPSGTSASGATWNAHQFSYYGSTYQDSSCFEYLDSPATTSAITYKVKIAVTGGTAAINKFTGTSNYYGVSTITAMEVSA